MKHTFNFQATVHCKRLAFNVKADDKQSAIEEGYKKVNKKGYVNCEVNFISCKLVK